MALHIRVASLETRLSVVEQALKEERKVMTAQMIELLKHVHEIRGRLPRIEANARNARKDGPR